MLFFIIRFKTVGSNLPQPATAGYLRAMRRPYYGHRKYAVVLRILVKHTTIRSFSRAPPPAANRLQQNTTIDATLYHLHVTPTAPTAQIAVPVLYKTVIYNKMTCSIRGGAIFPPHAPVRTCQRAQSKNDINWFRALLHFLLHLQR